MASSAASLAKMCQKNGLCKAFYPQDLRHDVCRGLWPSEEMLEDTDKCVRAIKALNSVLVADSYGGVDAVKWARNVYNSRHPLHLVLDLSAISPDLGTGCLWLGGEAASSDINLLQKNGISVILPAAKKPAIAESVTLKVYPPLDGTGVSQGDIQMSYVLEVLDQVIDDLLNGLSVLIHCMNGAHRSSTLLAAMLMRMCDKGAHETMNYVTACRNIVDFNSYPPKRQGRVASLRPADFLVQQEKVIRAGSADRDIVVDFNDMQTPMLFRRKCLELGFRTVAARPKALTAPQHFSLSSSMAMEDVEQGRKRRCPQPMAPPQVVKREESSASGSESGFPEQGMVSDQGGTTSQYEMVTSNPAFESDIYADSDGDYDLVNITSDAADSMDRLVNRREKRVSDSDHQSEDVGEADTEEVRASQFSNLRAIMYDLKQLDAKLSNFMMNTDLASGSGGPAAVSTPRREMDTVGDAEESDDSANYQPGPAPPADANQDDDAAAAAEEEEAEEDAPPKDFEEVMRELEGAGAAGEVLDRVVKLLESQRLQTQRLLHQEEERRTTKGMVDKVLGTMLSNRPQDVMPMLEVLGPAQIMALADTNGMTILHHAARMGYYLVCDKVLSVNPGMADAITKVDGKPAMWTPLMVLVDQWVFTDNKCNVLKSLIDYSSVQTIMSRSLTGSTALMMAASRGNDYVVKRILFGLYYKMGSSEAAFSRISQHINQQGPHGKGCVDAALKTRISLANYLQRTWGGVPQLPPPSYESAYRYDRTPRRG
ncbi:DSPTP1 [Symbiodinium sp. CCMP2592]|nr:DSPTP1 [Symbiodinium sp. CCMP2592]